MEVKPIGDTFSQSVESDIISISDSKNGFVTVISTEDLSGQELEIEVSFPIARAFRYLDEGDLIRYWESGHFSSGHHLYEILSGGWSNGETLDPGMLSVSNSFGYREWFICTTNGCVTVLSNDQPKVKIT